MYPKPAICRDSDFDVCVLSCLLDVGGSQGCKEKVKGYRLALLHLTPVQNSKDGENSEQEPAFRLL